MSAPLLVLGVDGLPPSLLRQLTAENRAPNLARLVRRGSLGVLRSTPNYQSASAWTSLVTGVNPGRHGILHFTNPVRGSYEFAQIDARTRRAPTIWRMLSEAGVRVAALNVPVSYPAEPVDGVMVAGWLCPSASADGFTHPPELSQWLERQFGRYPIHPNVRRHASAGRYQAVAEAARHGIETKLEAARRILQRERPEVLCAVVTETDSLQHWCWHLLDPEHPASAGEDAARWRETLLSAYTALDDALGRLLDEAGEGADVLVVSDHGQAPNSGGQVLLRPWLIAQGYLVTRRRSVSRRALDALLRPSVAALRRHAGNRLKAWLRARFPALERRAQASARAVAADWPRTRAWTETGHIFVNTRGVWPEGCVDPGDEREALLAKLTEGLRALRDPLSGEQAVARVTRGDEQFDGPHAELMPDLLVHWHNDLQVTGLIDADGAPVRRQNPPELPTGAHHPEGTLLVAGPSFISTDRAPEHCIYDVAPTVLHLLGQAVPSYFDGEVMADLMTSDAAKDVQRRPVNLPHDRGRAPEPGGDETVRRRLRSLGYLE